MLILFLHDDRAQVVIHTANMIAKDWTNMTQAVWRSPFLRLSHVPLDMGPHTIGSGLRFHVDLRRYLLKYEKKLQRLVDQLSEYDFSSIKAAFLGSAPSRQVASEAKPAFHTSFGWLGLREVLNSIPVATRRDPKEQPHIVLQVSSIATLGAAPIWLSHFQTILSRSCTLSQLSDATKPKFNIVFPTAEEVRTSLDGYESGGSIHIKLQSAQQQKQLQYMHPLLCHWKHSASSCPSITSDAKKEAHRGPAAPHIKTYIRFTDGTHKSIDWALVTSANLSKQAWGDVVNKQGEVRVQSYETGVLVWPDLFKDSNRKGECDTRMVPTFGRNMPELGDDAEYAPQPGQHSGGALAVEDDEETEDEDSGSIDDEETEDENEEYLRRNNTKQIDGRVKAVSSCKTRIVVGLRMPYDLPLSSYSSEEVPWCATQSYTEPDWKGRAWGGFQPR